MKALGRFIVAAGLLYAPVSSAWGQAEGNIPPTIEIIEWVVVRDGLADIVYDRDFGIGTIDDVDEYIHQEMDEVYAVVEVLDPDWQDEDGGGGAQDEQIFIRFMAEGIAVWSPPVAPPIINSSDSFFGLAEDQGFSPTGDPLRVVLPLSFEIPGFSGKNQRRLRGEIDFDVAWEVEYSAANEKEPANYLAIGSTTVMVHAVEKPSLGPPNPPPFADAGPDRVVPAGYTVVLDGSRTFDGFNVGFDESDDANIFEKDRLTFTWEWISGPVRVDPVHTDAGDPKASVTLNVADPNYPYEYRLIVDDNVNALPSSDSVLITVVEELPEKNPPVAIIEGPANPQPVGSVVTLVSRSTDPDNPDDPNGLLLEYRWQQTDELGGPLTQEELLLSFQPLSGVTEKTSTWQALTPGTFYFRLLVDDGDFRSAASFSVEIIETETEGVTERADESSEPALTPFSPQNNIPAPPACGGGLLPFLAGPAGLCLLRRRAG